MSAARPGHTNLTTNSALAATSFLGSSHRYPLVTGLSQVVTSADCYIVSSFLFTSDPGKPWGSECFFWRTTMKSFGVYQSIFGTYSPHFRCSGSFRQSIGFNSLHFSCGCHGHNHAYHHSANNTTDIMQTITGTNTKHNRLLNTFRILSQKHYNIYHIDTGNTLTSEHKILGNSDTDTVLTSCSKSAQQTSTCTISS